MRTVYENSDKGIKRFRFIIKPILTHCKEAQGALVYSMITLLLPGRLLCRQLSKLPGSNQRAACDELSRVDAR